MLEKTTGDSLPGSWQESLLQTTEWRPRCRSNFWFVRLVSMRGVLADKSFSYFNKVCPSFFIIRSSLVFCSVSWLSLIWVNFVFDYGCVTLMYSWFRYFFWSDLFWVHHRILSLLFVVQHWICFPFWLWSHDKFFHTRHLVPSFTSYGCICISWPWLWFHEALCRAEYSCLKKNCIWFPPQLSILQSIFNFFVTMKKYSEYVL